MIADKMRKHIQAAKRIYRTKKQYRLYLVALAVLFTLIVCYVWDHKIKEIVVMDLNNTYQMLEADLINSVVENKGKGCEIPKLDPFDKEAMRFVMEYPKVRCSGHDWVECYMDECYIRKPMLEVMAHVFCVFRDIIFVTDNNYMIGPPHKITGLQVYKLTESDHVTVSCQGMLPEEALRFLPSTETRWTGRKAGFRRLPIRITAPQACGPHLNVLMLCFDSTSKNGFIRKMPKSLEALQELGALFFNGYNTVGDGTPAALFPILTGKSELEFPEIRKRFTKEFLDKTKFIFHPLSKMGYRTAYFEDSPFMGTFQYRFNGFKSQPADHYLLPLLQEEFRDYTKSNSMAYCLGQTPMYAVMLNLTYQFHQLTGNRFSFTFISDISHDNFNQISTADEDTAFFLRRLQQGGRLKETVVFVMGDHGTRFSAIRETFQGKLEERLPLLAIVPPELLQRSRPKGLEAMKANRDVLITPFDIHSTLTDILGIGELRNRYQVPGADTPRAMTLLQPIPSTRTCGEAGVLPHWCACASWQAVTPSEPIYKQIGDVLADYINNLTAGLRLRCSPRSLTSIESVLHQTTNEKVLKFKKNLDVDGHLGKFVEKIQPSSENYQAKIIMNPGRAVYEATLRYFVDKDYFAINERDISRLNSYGNESACISKKSPHLNKYCYCRS